MLSWGAWSFGCSCTAYFQAFIPTAAGQLFITEQHFLYFAWAIWKYYTCYPCWSDKACDTSCFWAASTHGWVMLNFSSTKALRASLDPFPAQPLLVLGIALTQVYKLELGLAELQVANLLSYSAWSSRNPRYVMRGGGCEGGLSSQILERSVCSSKDGALHCSSCVYTAFFADSINSVEKISAKITNWGTLAWEHNRVSLKATYKGQDIKDSGGEGAGY